MFLLDTNVVSELYKARPDSAVIAWMRRQRKVDLSISVITVMELEIGIQRLARKDPEQAGRLQAWFHKAILGGFSGRILPLDLQAARQCAPFHVPDPAPERDALIAATARASGLTVVTRNVKDFHRFGVPLLNPFEG